MNSVCWSSAFGQMSTNVVFREINTNALEVGTVFGRAYVLADRRTDRDVLRDQGVKFVNRLRALGVPVRYELPVGSTHLFVTVPGQPTAFRRAVDFAVEALAR